MFRNYSNCYSDNRISIYAFTLFIFSIFILDIKAQDNNAYADSILKRYGVPELGYAVVSSNKVHELNILGVKKINTNLVARPEDKFRIGSNTKAVTGFIAAQLVKRKKIKWDTKFFDLFPELKATSNPAYLELTLLNLLSFRTKLFPYTYTHTEPAKEQFKGSEGEQRYQFAQWFFQHDPVTGNSEINFSNLGYVAAALMLEKVSGRSYQDLVKELGSTLGIDFQFGSPNQTDSLQTWGHDQNLIPEKPGDNFKLNWLQAAGNINLTLGDYTKFIQEQLKGLKGQSQLLSQQEYEFLHFGLPGFAVGWIWNNDEKGRVHSYNIGNPGTFLSKVYVYKDADVAIILLANAQTVDSDRGLTMLYEELVKRYVH